MSMSGQKMMLGQSQSEATETLTQYFAYVAVICLAVMAAVGAFALSAQTALVWVDEIARPTAAIAQSAPPQATGPKVEPNFASSGTSPTTGAANAFAMLPAAVPVQMKSEVMTANF